MPTKSSKARFSLLFSKEKKKAASSAKKNDLSTSQVNISIHQETHYET
jgi:hypothetical protein